MRVDKNNPNQGYTDFWNWLLAGWNPIWIIALVFGYIYYLMTTYEV